jgi:hypothetical protein
MPQVRCGGREGIPVQLAVAYQDVSGIVGNLPPLMEIECQRIGALDTAEPRGQFRCELRQSSIGSVDVKPKLVPPAQLGDARKVVDGSDIHGARRSNHEEWSPAGLPILVNRSFERIHVHSLAAVRGDQPQCVAAQATKIHGFRDRAVRRARRIGGQPLLFRSHPATTHFEAQRPIAGDDHSDQVGHRRSSNEQTRCAFRKAEDRTHPPGYLPLHLHRSMIAASEVRIQP